MARTSKAFPFSNDLIRTLCSADQSFDQDEDCFLLSPHYTEGNKRGQRPMSVSPAKRESNQTPFVRKTAVARVLTEERRVALSVFIKTPEKSASQSRFKTAFTDKLLEAPNVGLLDWAQKYFPKKRSGRPSKLRKVLLSGKELSIAAPRKRVTLLSSTVSKFRLAPRTAFQPFHFPGTLSRSNDVSPRRT